MWPVTWRKVRHGELAHDMVGSGEMRRTRLLNGALAELELAHTHGAGGQVRPWPVVGDSRAGREVDEVRPVVRSAEVSIVRVAHCGDSVGDLTHLKGGLSNFRADPPAQDSVFDENARTTPATPAARNSRVQVRLTCPQFLPSQALRDDFRYAGLAGLDQLVQERLETRVGY